LKIIWILSINTGQGQTPDPLIGPDQMKSKAKADGTTGDLAARAGWMYYLAGMTQGQIAEELDLSRQRVQRLIARAIADGLIHVRLDHPIGSCLEMERALKAKYDLQFVRVAPTLADRQGTFRSVAAVAAGEVERVLLQDSELTVAVGTGRTLRAVAHEMTDMECPGHSLVSLIGNSNFDGSASFYEVLQCFAEKIGARYYPMPLPVIAKTQEERDFYRDLPHVARVRERALNCDVTVVGIGELGQNAPLVVDGFLNSDAMNAVVGSGGVGEIAGWAFDATGSYLTGGVNECTNGVRVEPSKKPIIGVAVGAAKHPGLLGAVKGKLINCLVTDEASAAFLLQS
jgi:DNA-binding transcriptional regulator LsrR (DeoR family)